MFIINIVITYQPTVLDRCDKGVFNIFHTAQCSSDVDFMISSLRVIKFMII